MSGDKKQAAPDQNEGEWEFKPNDDGSAVPPAAAGAQSAPPSSAGVEWTASEFIAHNKGMGWYTLLAGGALLITVVVYILTKDVVSAAIILFIAVIFGIVAARKPRVLGYRLDDKGLAIGQKFFPYSDFKSFTFLQEDAFSSITFLPLKRFAPSLSIYFAPSDEKRIVEILSLHLPMEQRSHEAVDRLMHRIRF